MSCSYFSCVSMSHIVDLRRALSDNYFLVCRLHRDTTAPEAVIDWSIISHQCKCMWTDKSECFCVASAAPLCPDSFTQCFSEHLRWVLHMQSISVVKLLPVCGDSAVNPPAAWICHVSEHVVISRYIFCTAYFFPLYTSTPGWAFPKCL